MYIVYIVLATYHTHLVGLNAGLVTLGLTTLSPLGSSIVIVTKLLVTAAKSVCLLHATADLPAALAAPAVR